MKDTVTVTEGELTLTYMRQYVAAFLSDFPQMTHSLHIEIRDIAGQMGKQLAAMVDLPQEHLKTVEDYATFRTPKTWFQHFKASHFPQWLLRKFPVVYHEEKQRVILQVGAVYPQLPEVHKKPGVIRYHYRKNSPYSTYPVSREGEEMD